jgi:hypothetical protein
MRGALPPLTQSDFMAWCSVKRRDNFTFTLLLMLTLVLFAIYPKVYTTSKNNLYAFNDVVNSEIFLARPLSR